MYVGVSVLDAVILLDLCSQIYVSGNIYIYNMFT